MNMISSRQSGRLASWPALVGLHARIRPRGCARGEREEYTCRALARDGRVVWTHHAPDLQNAYAWCNVWSRRYPTAYLVGGGHFTVYRSGLAVASHAGVYRSCAPGAEPSPEMESIWSQYRRLRTATRLIEAKAVVERLKRERIISASQAGRAVEYLQQSKEEEKWQPSNITT